jgi:hypothetical protein
MPQSLPHLRQVRLLSVIAVMAGFLSASDIAAAGDVPMPRPRPASLYDRFGSGAQPDVEPGTPSLAPAPELQNLSYPEVSAGPSACEIRLRDIAGFAPLPVLIGPGSCGAADVVRLDAVVMPDKTQVPLMPSAVLRCSMAEAVVHWVRSDMAPAALELGSPLKTIANFDSYDCRGRNRIAGAKISEHGRGNALDIRAVRLANGSTVELTSTGTPHPFRDRLRASACARFTTVLGPGSDGYHENHVHVDLAERRNGHRMCQWDLREPVASVPLPQPKPAALTDGQAKPL